MKSAIIWFSCFVFACGAHSLKAGNMESRTQELLKDVKMADLNSLNQQEKPLIISELKAILSQSKNGIETENAKILLINLGDAETIGDLIEKYRKHNPARPSHLPKLLGGCRQSMLIPLLAQDLNLEEKAQLERSGEDLFDYPRSIQSAGIIRSVLANSPDFHQEVKEWAVAFGNRITGGVEEFRAIVRQWWKENEEHFKKKDYAAVRPPKGWQPKQADGKK